MALLKCRLISQVGEAYFFGYFSEDTKAEVSITKEQFEKGLDFIKQSMNIPEGMRIYSSARRLWNTEDGNNNHPGDMYWASWIHMEDGRCPYWDNCKDPRGHLVVILPNGTPFDTMSRASSCTKPTDKLHRCWVFEGEPENLTINGPKSENGAGSILAGDWHGYIRNGELVQ